MTAPFSTGVGEVELKITQLDMYATLWWLNKQPKEINAELKDESGRIGNYLKRNLTISAQRGSAPQAPLVANRSRSNVTASFRSTSAARRSWAGRICHAASSRTWGARPRAGWIPDAGVGRGVRRKQRAMAGQLYGAASTGGQDNGIERSSAA